MATETKVAGDIVVSEWDESYSRELLEMAANITVVVGDVLGIKSGSQYDTIKADPTAPTDNVASAIALEAISGTHSGKFLLCVVRGPINVNKDQLTYGGATSQTVAEAALEALVPRINLVPQPTDSETQTT